MPIVKIQHADPQSSQAIAFDVLHENEPDQARDNYTLNKDSVRETFVLESGHFKLLELAGGLFLREVPHAEVIERERKAKEARELEAEVARETLARENAEREERTMADREARKAEIAKRLGPDQRSEDKTRDSANPNTNIAPSRAPPNSEENPPPRHEERRDNAQTIDEHLNSAGVKPEHQPSEAATFA